jgi:hypothetical protein
MSIQPPSPHTGKSRWDFSLIHFTFAIQGPALVSSWLRNSRFSLSHECRGTKWLPILSSCWRKPAPLPCMPYLQELEERLAEVIPAIRIGMERSEKSMNRSILERQ